jgi:hypothetical protein
MGWTLVGLAMLILGLWALARYTRVDARQMVALAQKHGKQAVGVVLLAASVFFAVRGNWVATVFLAPIGLGLLKVGPWAGGPFAQNTTKATGQRSTVRSVYLEMELDHDSGALSGFVRRGAYQGINLDMLDEAALGTLMREIADDPDSRGLLEAYLDRRFPGRREHVDENARARQARPSASQAMTEEEAYQVLGLPPGASADDIRAAHRALMKRLHPDQGGSTWLAAKLNQAKDLLLKRHG